MSINPRLEAGAKAAYNLNPERDGYDVRYLKWEELDEEDRIEIRYQVGRVLNAVESYDARLAMIRERG